MRRSSMITVPVAILPILLAAAFLATGAEARDRSLAPAAIAGCVPDRNQCIVPAFIRVVGAVDGGAHPDPAGLTVIRHSDFAGNHCQGIAITLDFSECCDIVLCADGVGHDCARSTVRGYTNASGEFAFTVMGAARDPGNQDPPAQYPGGVLGSVRIIMEPSFVEWRATAIALDQNGAARGSSGTTGSDIANLVNLYGSVALGAPYRGRGDIDADGTISGADVAALIGHLGRLALIGGVGCTSLCTTAACP